MNDLNFHQPDAETLQQPESGRPNFHQNLRQPVTARKDTTSWQLNKLAPLKTAVQEKLAQQPAAADLPQTIQFDTGCGRRKLHQPDAETLQHLETAEQEELAQQPAAADLPQTNNTEDRGTRSVLKTPEDCGRHNFHQPDAETLRHPEEGGQHFHQPSAATIRSEKDTKKSSNYKVTLGYLSACSPTEQVSSLKIQNCT